MTETQSDGCGFIPVANGTPANSDIHMLVCFSIWRDSFWEVPAQSCTNILLAKSTKLDPKWTRGCDSDRLVEASSSLLAREDFGNVASFRLPAKVSVPGSWCP